jgi:hypothetical protein
MSIRGKKAGLRRVKMSKSGNLMAALDVNPGKESRTQESQDEQKQEPDG